MLVLLLIWAGSGTGPTLVDERPRATVHDRCVSRPPLSVWTASTPYRGYSPQHAHASFNNCPRRGSYAFAEFDRAGLGGRSTAPFERISERDEVMVRSVALDPTVTNRREMRFTAQQPPPEGVGESARDWL